MTCPMMSRPRNTLSALSLPSSLSRILFVSCCLICPDSAIAYSVGHKSWHRHPKTNVKYYVWALSKEATNWQAIRHEIITQDNCICSHTHSIHSNPQPFGPFLSIAATDKHSHTHTHTVHDETSPLYDGDNDDNVSLIISNFKSPPPPRTQLAAQPYSVRFVDRVCVSH